MWTIPTYILAAFAEIGGCFAFWAWLRLGKTPLWLVPGMASLAMLAWALTRIEANFAGRAYAAYRPDRWDAIGSTISVLGAIIVLIGPRGT